MDQESKTIKLTKKHKKTQLHDIKFGNDFLDMTPNAQATTTK